MLLGLRRFFDENKWYGLLTIDISKRIGGVNNGWRHKDDLGRLGEHETKCIKELVDDGINC